MTVLCFKVPFILRLRFRHCFALLLVFLLLGCVLTSVQGQRKGKPSSGKSSGISPNKKSPIPTASGSPPVPNPSTDGSGSQQPTLGKLRVNLDIRVDRTNRWTGTLVIKPTEPIRETTSAYTILPFWITDLETDVKSAVATAYKLPSDKFTVINLVIVPSTNPQEIQVHFQINPEVSESAKLPPDLNTGPNFFLIEDRGESRRTMHFRFDRSNSSKSFKDLSVYANAMLVPDEIRFSFPRDTTFYTVPPTTQSSNISEGDSPGRQALGEPSFITDTNFYKNHPLSINYILPLITISLVSILYAIALALAAIGLGLLAIPEEMLKKAIRLLLALLSNILAATLVIYIVVAQGPSYLWASFISLIPVAVIYSFTWVLLVINYWPIFKKLWPKSQGPSA